MEIGKGRYDLQYRTAGDGRVREEHAAMHGITLPADDPFWDKYYPPNGWRCRCTAVEVNKGKYPVSDSEEARRTGDKATTKLDRFGNNKAGIFRFNPGKEGKVFPPKHPYLPKGCEGCTRGMGNLAYNPDSEKCQVCTGIKKAWDKLTVEQRRQQYGKLKANPNYRDVVFNEETGGLKATHKDHSFDKDKGWYEKTAQSIGFNHGHSVIFELEDHTQQNVKNTEGLWDNLKMEIGGAETGTANNIRNALKHCASKPDTEIAIVFMPNYSSDYDIDGGLKRFEGLKKTGTSQWKHFKEIYFISKDRIIKHIGKPA